MSSRFLRKKLDINELPEDERLLCEAARDASKNAYAPYSGYHVGAAVFCRDGSIYPGANQENYYYSPTAHGEEVAYHTAAMNGRGNDVIKLACMAREGERYVAPCGHCLVRMAQYEQRAREQIIVLFGGLDLKKVARVKGVSTLMPLSFLPKDLGDLEK